MVGAIAVAILLAVGVAAGLYRSKLLAEPAGNPSPVAISAGPETGLVAPSGRRLERRARRRPPTTAPGTPTTVIIVPFTVSGTAQVGSCSGSVKMWKFDATVSGGALKSATLHYMSTSADMTVSGNKASRTVPLIASEVTWWVVTTATDGRTAETPHKTSSCP